MLVVADSSPLIALINVGHIDILPQLFGTVIIPPAVAAELRDAKRTQAIRSFIGSPPTWLIERTPKIIGSFPLLDSGEVAAINLALEMKADLLLIDESMGRKTAVALGIQISGTIGILEQAADKNMLDLKDAFDRIKETDFWISHELLDVRLKLHLERKKKDWATAGGNRMPRRLQDPWNEDIVPVPYFPMKDFETEVRLKAFKFLESLSKYSRNSFGTVLIPPVISAELRNEKRPHVIHSKRVPPRP